MENKILDDLQGGTESVMMITTSQLKEIVEYIMGEQRKYDERNLADKEQLRPASYWVSQLGVDPSTLWRWEKQGRIKATRLGCKVFYKQSDFEKIESKIKKIKCTTR